MTAAIRIAVAGVTIALASLPARAEAAGDTRVQIGGDFGGLAGWPGAFTGSEVRVTVPVNERGAVETFGGVARPAANDTLGFYGVMFKRHLRGTHTPGFQPFLSFGGAGIVYVAERHSIITPPFAGIVGGGVERRVHDRVIVRLEAQALTLLVIPVAVRVMTGVSVPIGRSAR